MNTNRPDDFDARDKQNEQLRAEREQGEAVVEAFRLAKSGAGLDWLRAVREAGRLADSLPSCKGQRNVKSHLTRFCEQVRVTRAQVHTWRKVAAMPDAQFAAYCDAVERADAKPTISGVLGLKPQPKRRSLTAKAAERHRRIKELMASTTVRATTTRELVDELIDYAYDSKIVRGAA
jgi:hypothetical protein